MIAHRKTLALVLITLLTLFCTVTPGRSEYAGEPSDLVYRSTAVFKGFMADANMNWFRHNLQYAKGILIIPQQLRGGFIIGGSGGSGILVAQDQLSGTWSSPAFYTLGSVSFGFQAGADASEIILMIMTERGLQAMLTTEFKLGADVAVAAGPVGGSAKAQTADILAFGRSQGAYGGVSLEGAIINPRDDWNRQYYGRSFTGIADILLKQTAHNKDDEPLRQLLPKPGPASKPIGR